MRVHVVEIPCCYFQCCYPLFSNSREQKVTAEKYPLLNAVKTIRETIIHIISLDTKLKSRVSFIRVVLWRFFCYFGNIMDLW